MDKQFDGSTEFRAAGVSRRGAQRRAGRILAALIILAALPVSSAHAQTYTITDLGTLGGAASKAYVINDNGQVVGQADTSQKYWGTDSDGQRVPVYYHNAFLWSPKTPGGTTGKLQGLKTQKGNSYASAINASAQVAGAGDPPAQVMLWQPNGTVAVLTGGYTAEGINESGQVVGFGYSSPAVPAFIWQNGAVHAIANLTGASAINSAGQVAGASTTGSPALWTPATPNGTTGTGVDLDPAGGWALGLNSATAAHPVQVVGYVYSGVYDGSTPDTVAFIWDSSHRMQIIGPPAAPGIDSWATGINAAGQVVGSSAFRAVLWQAGVMTDLNTLIPSNSGWTLMTANGINGRGQIVGWGYSATGAAHAFLLTPK